VLVGTSRVWDVLRKESLAKLKHGEGLYGEEEPGEDVAARNAFFQEESRKYPRIVFVLDEIVSSFQSSFSSLAACVGAKRDVVAAEGARILDGDIFRAALSLSGEGSDAVASCLAAGCIGEYLRGVPRRASLMANRTLHSLSDVDTVQRACCERLSRPGKEKLVALFDRNTDGEESLLAGIERISAEVALASQGLGEKHRVEVLSQVSREVSNCFFRRLGEKFTRNTASEMFSAVFELKKGNEEIYSGISQTLSFILAGDFESFPSHADIKRKYPSVDTEALMSFLRNYEV
ncbi:MAG: uncharacterized protein A8A55_3103, partial [Amphiamblys sp. WSBS2006]